MIESQGVVQRIAVVGGGPSALFLYKQLVERGNGRLSIDIFERKSELGSGMPYSAEGANVEHITNVSCDEIPPLVTSIRDWLESFSAADLTVYNIDLNNFSEHRVLPRLLFGRYLANQFGLLRTQSLTNGVTTTLHCNTAVVDLIDNPKMNTVQVEVAGGTRHEFDQVIICTGHNWPLRYEGRISGYFDSPYPPAKLQRRFNHAVAIRGSSLTAVDAIRTLARHNGRFERDKNNKLTFIADAESPQFRMVMHSRNGLLPCVRFHSDSPQIGSGSLLTPEIVERNMQQNDGFLSLDFVFDKNFKEPLRTKDPKFFERIKDLTIEEFVSEMLGMREGVDPFDFFRGEYAEARKSIQRHQSIHWKEMLSALSFAMNYPAKHMSAEDMYRHQHVLMPLISIVIAFVPQSSCEEILALHDAGHLDLVQVGADSEVKPLETGGITYSYQNDIGEDVELHYPTFVDCIGQPHLSIEEFPFRTLVDDKSIVPARLQFRNAAEGQQLHDRNERAVERDSDGRYFLKVAGMKINDDFQIVDPNDNANPRIYMMAVPYMGGYNPDYSGLDFSEKAATIITDAIFTTAT